MSWSEGRVDQRKRLIGLWESGFTPTELAARFEVSRQTVYAVIGRWLEDGLAGLEDRTSRPHSNARQTSPSVSAALLNLKDRYPKWGPDKLVRLLLDDAILLSASTARDILSRNGRVQARRARPPRWSPAISPKIIVPGPAHSMSADHKGQFRMGNGCYCFPLTIADPASRYVFAAQGASSTAVDQAIPVFVDVFREWGVPEQMITDNGNPFCSARSMGGLTELSKLWIKLGIQHVRIQPGRPQQNGIHERMHRTLKDGALQPPQANMRAQQRHLDAYLLEFNNVRPHQALGQERPASLVQRYRREYPERLPPIEYPAPLDVRKLNNRGYIKWKGESQFVSEVLRGEFVAMQQLDAEQWRLYFGPVHLATWNRSTKRFTAPAPERSEELSGSPHTPPDSPESPEPQL